MSEQDDEALVRAFTAPLDRLDNFQCRVSRADGYVRFGVSVDSVTAPIAAVANAIREAAKQHLTSEPAASVPVPTPEVEEIRKRHAEAVEFGKGKVTVHAARFWAENIGIDAHRDRATLLALLARSQDGRRG